ncbi:MAG: phage major capsid protein [Peptostreptococcaceae bacterium]
MDSIFKKRQQENAQNLYQALASEDQKVVEEGIISFQNATAEIVKDAYINSKDDDKILLQRGFRVLTSEENKFYEKLIEGTKHSNPKQAFADLDIVMPETIREEIFKNLVEEHPLLSVIDFVDVKFLTKWIMQDHSVQTAVWGPIDSEITKEITSAFKEEQLGLNKLSAFAVITKDMLDLGPRFMDKYIRTVLKDSILNGIEQGIINGTGKDQPIGLLKNVSSDVIVTGGVYPDKDILEITNINPTTYGELLAKLTVTEKGSKRNIGDVCFACNNKDYFEKIMPATTVQRLGDGGYSTDIFPYPTKVIKSNAIPDGRAIVFLPKEYFFGIGTSKDGKIEYSDDFKFLEDFRVYKIRFHGQGRAFDNSIAIVLDITNLEPMSFMVNTDGTV